MASASCFSSWCSWQRKKLPAVVGNCLQEVSPLCAAGFSAACKQGLIFIVWDRREEEAVRKVLRGHGEGKREREKRKKARERVREVKSVFRNVPGQALGWHSPDDCEGILGRGKPGNPVQHLQPSPSLPLFYSLSLRLPPFSLSSALSIFVSRAKVAASLSAIKNIIQPGRLSNGETGLCQTGGAWKTAEPTSPHFCYCWQSAAKSAPCIQPCPSWTLKNPPDSKFQ